MQKNPTSESGVFNPRLLLAIFLCSTGVFLGMFSLAATPPVETTRADTSVPPDPANFLSTSTFGSDANRPAPKAFGEEALPPGVPLPPGALNPEGVRGQFSPNGASSPEGFLAGGQGDPSSSSQIAKFPGFAGTPPQPGMASGANQQPAPLTPNAFGAAASESMPLASGAQNDWPIVPSPNALLPKAALSDVTCVSASDCWAVGYSFIGSVTQTLIERWDGTSWTIVSSPNTSSTRSNGLSGVTCVSASDCWAVGHASNGSAAETLVERWDGTSWAIVASPSPVAPPPYETVGTNLVRVTCLTASDCWAVGYYQEIIFNPPSGQSQTLIEHWDGTAWALVTSPNTSETANNVLVGVACAAAADCWAVGAFTGDQIQEALLARWDGTSWAIVTAPTPLGSQSSGLNDVTCVSASDCWAVGQSSNVQGAQTLVERWDGTSWAVVISANTAAAQGNDALRTVACVSASNCWAVGYSITGSAAEGGIVVQTLTEHWDGTSWVIVGSPNTSATEYNWPSGLTCVSASDCWVVGSAAGSSATQTLVEHWNGTSWTIATSANTLSPTSSILLGVTCVSASDCWAVGYSFNGANYQTVTERWDGTSWAIVASANASTTQNNVLNGVTCVSASDCWAVGYAISHNDAGYTYQTLVERWDGTSWAVVSSPNPPGLGPSILNGVTCASASDCWAVGQSSNVVHLQTLVERWDGTAWTIVTSPNTLPTQDNILYGLTCVSASDCWAVGYYSTGSVYQTVIERWDGTAWAIITSPNTSATQLNVLYGVTCVSASDCWAAGYYHNGSNYQTLTEQWNGSSWAIVPSPNTSATQDNVLLGLTCVSASDCWTVGEFYNGAAVQTIVEHWDGTAWSIVSSSNTSPTQRNLLAAVTCVSASDCWAVGYYGSSRTLVLRYTPSPPIPTSVVSRKTHGTSGDFDIDLPLIANPGIECRTGGAAGDHQVVITFPSAVTFASATVSSGTGAVASSSGSGTSAITVNLTGVSNAQTITLTLSGMNDGTSVGDVGLRMGVLLGDTTANGSVNSSDIGQAKSNSGQTTNAANFRTDVTVNGAVNSSDIGTIKAQSGTSLP